MEKHFKKQRPWKKEEGNQVRRRAGPPAWPGQVSAPLLLERDEGGGTEERQPGGPGVRGPQLSALRAAGPWALSPSGLSARGGVPALLELSGGLDSSRSPHSKQNNEASQGLFKKTKDRVTHSSRNIRPVYQCAAVGGRWLAHGPVWVTPPGGGQGSGAGAAGLARGGAGPVRAVVPSRGCLGPETPLTLGPRRGKAERERGARPCSAPTGLSAEKGA